MDLVEAIIQLNSVFSIANSVDRCGLSSLRSCAQRFSSPELSFAAVQLAAVCLRLRHFGLALCGAAADGDAQ
jgi:hypothetical protein